MELTLLDLVVVPAISITVRQVGRYLREVSHKTQAAPDVCVCTRMAHDARVIVKSKLHYFVLMKDRLDQPRRNMFNATCFGPWLDLTYVDNEEGLVHYMLQRQCHQKDDNYDIPLVYSLNGHMLHFGRHEFCLITGLKFGLVSFRKWRSGDIPFRERVFPHKVGQHVKLIDLLSVIEDEEVFIKLCDEDAIRVCLLLTLEVIFMGKELGCIIDDIFMRMVEDIDEWNAMPWGEHIWRQLYESIRNVSEKHIRVPIYSLNGFVAGFKIWIIESTNKSEMWWNKKQGVIPRAVAWSKYVSFREFDNFDYLFAKDSKPNLAITPTKFEAEAEWYIRSWEFFRWYTPRAPPLPKGGPWEEYFQKRAARRASNKSIGEGCSVSMSLEERVKALEARTVKLENIIEVFTCKCSQQDKVHTSPGEKVLDLSDEYCSEDNDFFKLFDSPAVDEVEKLEKAVDEAEIRRKLIEKCVTKKRIFERVVRPPYVIKRSKSSQVPSPEKLRCRKSIQDPVITEKLLEVRPWVEVLKRPFQNIDKIYISYEIDGFMLKDGWRNCVFPWSDLVVDRNFWDALIGLDNNRKGWLLDEHIDLWVSYMWHTRPSDMDWSMVSCFFLPLLMKGTMPVWYANKETYPLGWGDVERVFIPINEPEAHWSLAVFHIQTGQVTFFDSGPVFDNEMRPFYVSMRGCLENRLPELLEQVGVFEQKGIDPMSYKITFSNALNVPKQAGVFDDCGVWLCIFLYRLGNGRLLDVDNPVQTALAYRERLISFYYKHKIHVA